jgi:hypothetical protein
MAMRMLLRITISFIYTLIVAHTKAVVSADIWQLNGPLDWLNLVSQLGFKELKELTEHFTGILINITRKFVNYPTTT